jgi:hypothetical protein
VLKCGGFFATALFMSDRLEPHSLSTLFPPLADQELEALADDIRQHGQREPVLTYEGKVLDGWNRVRACRQIGRKPWVMAFDPVSAKMTPEQLVISANLRRRHLSVGQMSAIVVELSEQIEREGGNTSDAFNGEFGAKRTGQAGRPKTECQLGDQKALNSPRGLQGLPRPPIAAATPAKPDIPICGVGRGMIGVAQDACATQSRICQESDLSKVERKSTKDVSQGVARRLRSFVEGLCQSNSSRLGKNFVPSKASNPP